MAVGGHHLSEGLVSDRELPAGKGLPLSQGEPDLPPLETLTGDVEAMRGILAHGAEGDPNPAVRQFELGSRIALEPGLDSEVRAAALEALSELEGITLDKDARDELGRRGVSVEILEPAGSGPSPVRHILIFDPDDAAILSGEDRYLKPVRFQDGNISSATVLQAHGVVPDTRSAL